MPTPLAQSEEDSEDVDKGKKGVDKVEADDDDGEALERNRQLWGDVKIDGQRRVRVASGKNPTSGPARATKTRSTRMRRHG